MFSVSRCSMTGGQICATTATATNYENSKTGRLNLKDAVFFYKQQA